MRRWELYWRAEWQRLRRVRLGGFRLTRNKSIVLVLYLAFVGYFVWSSYRDMGPDGLVMWVVIAAIVMSLIIVVALAQGNVFPKISEQAHGDYEGHRVKIAEALVRVAVLVDRAGVEALWREEKVMEEHRGVCRRRTLDVARRPEIWDGLTEDERGLLIGEEGSWASETTWPLVQRVEDVRVLRWVLGLDEVLVPFAFLKADISPAPETTVKAAEILAGKGCLPPWDLRPAQAEAEGMVYRCLAEGVVRGFYQVEDEAKRRACLEIVEECRLAPGADALLGGKPVCEASDDDVRWAAVAAVQRGKVLAAVIDYLNGEVSAELRLGGEE